MLDAIRPFGRYFDFFGRSRRREFWLWALLNCVMIVTLSFLGLATGLASVIETSTAESVAYQMNGGLLANIWFYATIVPNFTVTARRLHDTGRTAWWMALPFTPILVFNSQFLLMNFLSAVPPDEADLRRIMIWSILGMLVIFITQIVFLVFLCLDGSRGVNRYGPNPKGE
jgi:uncharacterized membrane protein YhaH (DUF805 family)